MSIDTEIILARLRRHYHPFIHLSVPRLEETIDLLQIDELADGEPVPAADDPAMRENIYILDGELELSVRGEAYRITTAEDTCIRPLFRPYLPVDARLSARGRTLICRADSGALEYLLFWDEAMRCLDDENSEAGRRMAAVKRAGAFKRLPVEAVFELVRLMRPMPVARDQEIVRQGDAADSYYLIVDGSAEVWESSGPGARAVKVNELVAGDAFGEQALMTDNTRSATVRMSSDGLLLVLDRSDFETLISKPMMNEIDAADAQDRLRAGYRLIDVRYPEEYDREHIPGARLMPIGRLRKAYDEFTTADKYIVYCANGQRSAVAALLLNQNGYKALSLHGGILDWPFEKTAGPGGGLCEPGPHD